MKFIDNVLKTILNSYALIGFFGVFGFWLFFGRKTKPNSNLANPTTHGSTLTDVEAKSYANVCYEAMEPYGTDEDLLSKVLLNLNDPTFNHVYKAFGKRDSKDLVQWLVSELSEEELNPYRKFTLVP